MNAINVIKRSISTSSQLNGKKNFRKFLLYNKRGPRVFKEQQRIEPHPACPIDKRGVKDTGRKINGVFQDIPEMIPQLIVPNLTGCTLKPYVSYKTPDVIQSEFTCDDLFNAVYGKKIVEDFKNGKLKEDGSPAEPSEEELLNAETAFLRARQTGTDIFSVRSMTHLLRVKNPQNQLVDAKTGFNRARQTGSDVFFEPTNVNEIEL